MSSVITTIKTGIRFKGVINGKQSFKTKELLCPLAPIDGNPKNVQKINLQLNDFINRTYGELKARFPDSEITMITEQIMINQVEHKIGKRLSAQNIMDSYSKLLNNQ